MNTLLLLVLAVALGQVPGTELREYATAFAELPAECAAEYDPELRRWRQVDGTLVRRCDLDGDGTEELLVWTGESGSGGETWSVMTRRGGGWRRAGWIFGTAHFIDQPPHRGLVVETPCGWDEATWEFWSLENGVLKSRVKVEIRYLPSEGNILRTRPAEIRIREEKP